MYREIETKSRIKEREEEKKEGESRISSSFAIKNDRFVSL